MPNLPMYILKRLRQVRNLENDNLPADRARAPAVGSGGALGDTDAIRYPVHAGRVPVDSEPLFALHGDR